jgi:hypothetical protein
MELFVLSTWDIQLLLLKFVGSTEWANEVKDVHAVIVPDQRFFKG